MAAVPTPIFRRSTLSAAVLGFFLLLAAGAASQNLPRNALWEVVHNICVPGQTLNHNPLPCVQVDLRAGNEKGFAVLRDPRGVTHFLLIPTARIPGIESPVIVEPDAVNYFANAWEARRYVFEALGKTLPRDAIGLAINSTASRSQDQLHIHIDCIQPEVLEVLHTNQTAITSRWAPFPVPLFGRRYAAMWVAGEDLGPSNPFRLLAEELPGAARDMGDYTLAAVGFTRADGTPGFVLLADRVGTVRDDSAYGEQLLDHACRIATQ